MEIKVIARHDKNAIYAADRPPIQSSERRHVTCGESIVWAQRQQQPVGGIDGRVQTALRDCRWIVRCFGG